MTKQDDQTLAPTEACDPAMPAGETVPQEPEPLPRGKPTHLSAGQSVDDFDLLAKIGEGSFAVVFLARQRSMQRLVALKISPDRGTEPQTLAQLDHPHIVRVYDQRVMPKNGLRLLYMPYLAGGTLKEVIARIKATEIAQRSGRTMLDAVDAVLLQRGDSPPTDGDTRAKLRAMTWPEAVCWLGARLAEALAYAHSRGVLHRDLKPANVLLGADASPRLADFNISFCSEVEGTDAASSFGGSLAYMSPEQLEVFNPSVGRAPDSLDHRSDIYSLGVTLWELLTGFRPFAQAEPDDELPTLTAMMARRESGIHPTLEAMLPGNASDGLRAILKQCLQAAPAKRPKSAQELARQLDLCLKPRARDLLFPAPGWRSFVARHPVATLYFIGLFFNILAAWFSIVYNGNALVKPYPAAKENFELLLFIINGTFFPLCMALFYLIIRPVSTGLSRSRREAIPSAELAAMRKAALRLGPGSVLVCLWAWVAAGVIFPVALHLSVHELPAAFHLHFLASQTLCGLIAVSYPQFTVTLVSLRGFYPHFVENATLSEEDRNQLRKVASVQKRYLILAASIPMLAVGLLAGIGGDNRAVLGLLSIIALAGFGIAYWLTNAIAGDVNALENA